MENRKYSPETRKRVKEWEKGREEKEERDREEKEERDKERANKTSPSRVPPSKPRSGTPPNRTRKSPTKAKTWSDTCTDIGNGIIYCASKTKDGLEYCYDGVCHVLGKTKKRKSPSPPALTQAERSSPEPQQRKASAYEIRKQQEAEARQRRENEADRKREEEAYIRQRKQEEMFERRRKFAENIKKEQDDLFEKRAPKQHDYNDEEEESKKSDSPNYYKGQTHWQGVINFVGTGYRLDVFIDS